MEYKYTATFDHEVHASAADINSYVSEASLDNLRPLIPDSVDLNKNIDLMGVAFNAAVVNKFNKNGDGIDSKTAVAINDYFVHKPTNIEHNREQIVGHIVSSGFSSFQDSSIMSKEEVLSTSEPVNISLAAVVYKMANASLADMLEEGTDGEGELSTVISTSWELGFNDFVVAVGSKDLKNCEVLTGEDAEAAKEHLRAFGGSGSLEDGRPCYRLVVGEVYPLGVAFTTKPAADVKGVLVAQDNFKEKNEELVAKNKDNNIIKNKSSQKSKTNVFDHKETINMETEKLINSLEALLNEKRRENDFSEEAVASISKLVNDVIIEKSAEWKTQVEEAQAQKKELEEARAELSEKFDSISEQLKNAQDKIESLETEKSERLSEAAFNGRMEDLSSQFELSEDDLKIVAAEVKQLDVAEESFSSYKEKFEKIWSHKNKEFLKSQAEALEAQIEAEVQKRLSQDKEEPTEEVVEAALEQVEEEAEVVPNNNAESAEAEENLAEKFAQAFSKDNISIKY